MIVKINNFRGDLSDISAKKTSLLAAASPVDGMVAALVEDTGIDDLVGVSMHEVALTHMRSMQLSILAILYQS